MSYIDSDDPIVDALQTILSAAITTRLSAIGTGLKSPLRKVYGHPIPLTLVPQLQLPALSVYRTASQNYNQGRRRRWLRTPFRVDYVMRSVTHATLDDAWPLLHLVHEACVEAIEENRHGGGELFADGVGVQGLDDHSPEFGAVTYAYATAPKGALYPMFSSTFPLVHERQPLVTPTALPDLAGLDATLDIDDGTPEDEVPLHLEGGTALLLEDDEHLWLEDGIAPVEFISLEIDT